MLDTLTGRWGAAWRDAAASAAAAAIAWLLAVWLFGHQRPVFAAVTAIVCLAPGLPSHGRQAVGLMLGVATGIVAGDLVLLLLPQEVLLPHGLSLLRVVFATFFAILLGASFGQPPVVPIQAGVSAMLVLAMGPETAGIVRLADVSVGVGVGLLFSQVLLTPDPLQIIDKAADDFLRRIEDGLKRAQQAAQRQDSAQADAALGLFSNAHASLAALSTAIENARHSTRWSVRGRLSAQLVDAAVARYDRGATRLFARSLLLAEALSRGLENAREQIPDGLAQRIAELAQRCADVLAGRPVAPGEPLPARLPDDLSWRQALDHLGAMEGLLADLGPMQPAGQGTSTFIAR
ncbi:aromatic acid exporter family protein [Verticiella sediminum]|uniref:Aromatic acid exporter family protein n=2 Tax=Verticiella sediminum TaxID=1247510 RepID=A0A556AJS2_9BURK|nr:aromatic acid exporter family protein [Verticiella sediminum]